MSKKNILNDDNDNEYKRFIVRIGQYLSRDTRVAHVKEEAENFFKNEFNNYELKDKIKLINDIQNKLGRNRFLQCLLATSGSNDVKNNIKNNIRRTIKEAVKYLKTDDITEIENVINVFWLNMTPEKFFSTDEEITSILEKTYNQLNLNNISYNNSIIEILKCYTYSLARGAIVKDDKNRSFDYFEKIIIDYLNKVPLEKNITKDKFIILLFEVKDSFDSIKINESLENLIDRTQKKTDLIKYNSYINENIPLPDDYIDEFTDAVSLYRMKNGVIPEKLCVYINKFYEENHDLLSRMATIDFMKHFLSNKNLGEISVCACDKIIHGGLASGTRNILMPICPLINKDSFHEITHIIQNKEIKQNIFSGDNYLMEKDFVLRSIFGWDFYMRNHKRFIYEIDADIRGEEFFIEYKQKINNNDYSSEKENLKREKQQRMKKAKFICNSKGGEYSKSQIFDYYINKYPQYIESNPILKIEYTEEGRKKEITQILNSLETELNTRSEDEIYDIAKCIFTDEYLLKLSAEELRKLNDFNSNNSCILNVQKKLMEKINIQSVEENDENEEPDL